MALYLLGMLSEPRPRPTKTIHVGIVARDGEDIEVRTVSIGQIPQEYRMLGPIGDNIIKNLDAVFRDRKQASSYDTTLAFYEIDDHGRKEDENLSQVADRLFKEKVSPSYMQETL